MEVIIIQTKLKNGNFIISIYYGSNNYSNKIKKWKVYNKYLKNGNEIIKQNFEEKKKTAIHRQIK